jgi:hypothetical protein
LWTATVLELLKWHLASHTEPSDEVEPVPTCLEIDGHRDALRINELEGDRRY